MPRSGDDDVHTFYPRLYIIAAATAAGGPFIADIAHMNCASDALFIYTYLRNMHEAASFDAALCVFPREKPEHHYLFRPPKNFHLLPCAYITADFFNNVV